MEEFAEVSMAQEFSLAAEQPMPSPHGEDHDARVARDDHSSAGPLAVDEVFPPQRASPASKGSGGFAMASELDAAKKIAQLPTGMQAKYSSLPRTAQRALIK